MEKLHLSMATLIRTNYRRLLFELLFDFYLKESSTAARTWTVSAATLRQLKSQLPVISRTFEGFKDGRLSRISEEPLHASVLSRLARLVGLSRTPSDGCRPARMMLLLLLMFADLCTDSCLSEERFENTADGF